MKANSLLHAHAVLTLPVEITPGFHFIEEKTDIIIIIIIIIIIMNKQKNKINNVA
jgi:hypothetical protein